MESQIAQMAVNQKRMKAIQSDATKLALSKGIEDLYWIIRCQIISELSCIKWRKCTENLIKAIWLRIDKFTDLNIGRLWFFNSFIRVTVITNSNKHIHLYGCDNIAKIQCADKGSAINFLYQST